MRRVSKRRIIVNLGDRKLDFFWEITQIVFGIQDIEAKCCQAGQTLRRRDTTSS